jgi:hypothetical protein
MRKVSIPLEERRLIQAIRRPAGGFSLHIARPTPGAWMVTMRHGKIRKSGRRRLESTAMNTSNSDGDEICRQ